jgi:hypothetical protein
MRTLFCIPAFLPKNRRAWVIVSLLLFALLWFPALAFLDFNRELFDPRAGGSVGDGVRVLVSISFALLGIAGCAGWCIQRIGAAAFRRVYPKLESRYGAGVSLGHLLSLRRLWTLRWFRGASFTSAACLVVLFGLCAFFRFWRPADFEAYRGMAAECHPVWRAFAFRRFSRGDSAAELFAAYPPTRREEFGRYGIYGYGEPGFTGLAVTTKDGRLMSAAAGSCTWSFIFFTTSDDQLEREYQVYIQERTEKLRQIRAQQPGSHTAPQENAGPPKALER